MPESAVDHPVGRDDEVDRYVVASKRDGPSRDDLKFVRDSADILALTRVLNPGQEDTVNFTPPAPGEYVYICLMSGHGDMLGMRGILALKR